MRSIQRFPPVALLATLFGCGFGAHLAATERANELPVSTPVKPLTAPRVDPTPQRAPMMVRNEPPPATLPDERLPQYRMGYRVKEDLSTRELEKGEIRFVLLSPGHADRSPGHDDASPANDDGSPGHDDGVTQPLLCRVTVRIDGAPFTKARETRRAALRDAVGANEESPEETNDSSPRKASTDSPEASTVEVPEVGSPSDQSDTESSADVTDDGDSEESEPDEAEVNAPTAPSYQLTTDADALLRRYAEATGETIQDGETEWILTHWTDGPQVLWLHPYFQSFRADQRPAYRVIDRDRDGAVSSDELASSVEAFQKCDLNRDDIVDVIEIANVAGKLRELDADPVITDPVWLTMSDLSRVDTNAPTLRTALDRFDSDHDGRFSREELASLRGRDPDIDLLVDFDTGNAAESKLSVRAVAPELDATVNAGLLVEGVQVKIGHTNLLFSAVQGAASEQVSLGAVIDGYPLLPELDPNDDGRFTIRELRDLESRVRHFDTDQDGQLTPAETTPPIRVCIGLGATVHRELAAIRSIKRTDLPAMSVGPDWFVRMDRNRDNDLARNEFPGTDEQFAMLDADGDQLISADEATKSDKASSTSQPD